MSGGIRHLVDGAPPSRPSRVDNIGADNFNSIVERISGVNPTKLTQEVLGGKSEAAPEPAAAPVVEAYGAPTQGTPLQHAGGVSGSMYSNPEMHQQGQQLQQMQEEIRLLKERVAYYEDENGPQRFGGRGATASANAPDISPRERKRIEKRLAKQDKEGKGQDGDEPQDEPENEMESKEFRDIGIPMMEEFRSLAGLPSTPTYYASEEQPLQESFVDGYVERYDDAVVEEYQLTEEELHEAWVWFIESKGLTFQGFESFARETLENGNEEDAELILALEDEFSEADHQAILNRLRDAKKEAGQRGFHRMSPEDLGVKPRLRTMGAAKGKKRADAPFKSLAGGAEKSAVEDIEIIEEYQLTEEEHHYMWVEFLEDNGLTLQGFEALVHETFENGNEEDAQLILALEDEFEEGVREFLGKVATGARKAVGVVRKVANAAPEAAGRAVGASARRAVTIAKGPGRAAKKFSAGVKAGYAGDSKAPRAEPVARMAKKAPPRVRPRMLGMPASAAATEDLEFEADSGPDGGPEFDWEKVLKKHKLPASDPMLQSRKDKSEGGFGGMSRRGK